MVLSRYKDAALDEALSLLPTGPAWTRDIRSNLARVLGGLGIGVAAAEQRAADVIEESDPRTTVEMLADWERVLGLPDDCFGAPTSFDDRRSLVTSRTVGEGRGTVEFFVALAAALGIQIQVIESQSNPSRVGDLCGSELRGSLEDFLWTVRAPLGEIQRAVCGVARAGDRIESFGDALLECVISRETPAHTLVRFTYQLVALALSILDADGGSYLVFADAGGLPITDAAGTTYVLAVDDSAVTVQDADGSTYSIPLTIP